MTKPITIALAIACERPPTEHIESFGGEDLWARADATLRRWARVAPTAGQPVVVNYTILFEDGLEVHGCYRLRRHDTILGNLARAVRRTARLCAGGDTLPWEGAEDLAGEMTEAMRVRFAALARGYALPPPRPQNLPAPAAAGEPADLASVRS